nr:hypothetical protein [Lachnospiraceae bacterium]
YAIGGPGQEAMATVPVTLLESIHSLYVATPTRILKNYNKAAKVSTELFYNINEREGVPATKAVEWSLAVPDPLNPGEYIDIPEYSPLYGMLTIKNGTVDIDKALLVDYAKKIPVPGDSENSRNLGPEDYNFVVGAKAADFEGNTVITYSSPVQITSESQIPTEIQFVWDEFRWDDDAQKEVFFRRNYSPITEEEIARREAAEKAKDRTVEPFYSNAIHNSQIIVLDQYGEQMYASLKLTGIKQGENGKLILSKPGSITVVATSCDGGKKSKQLKFKIAEGDVRFDPNVLIQDSTLNVMDNYEHSFINIGGSDTPWDVYGADECFNNMPANKYVYVHVAAVKTGNINMYGGQLGLDKWGGYDFGNNVMFNHSVKVTGGSIKATRTDMFDNYTTYVILPSAADTVITLTDNTVDKTLGRAKTTLTYTIHNTAISADKSRTITADKASILNWMYVRSDAYPEPAQNPNRVTYTIKDAKADAAANPGRTFAALITMDDLTTDAQFTISRFIGMSDDIADDDERINMEIDGRDDLKDRIQEITDDDGISNEEKEERIREIHNYVKDIIRGRNEAGGVIKPVNGGKFSIDFFRPVIDENNGQEYYDFWETPAGTYNFYATYGYIEGGQFKPLAPATKLSVKTAAAAVPTVKLASTTIKLNADSSTISVGLPEAAKGLGVIPYYELRNLNTNGVTDNQFSNLFRIGIDNADIDKPVMANALTLDLAPDFEMDFWIDIVNGKNIRSVRIKSWNDLKMLKIGQFKTKADDIDHPDEYNQEGDLVFSAANQKSAYQKFVKENCTGFLRLRSLGYDGRERDVDIKITVNIDSFFGN